MNLNECQDNDNSNYADDIYSKYDFSQPTSVYPITPYRSRLLNAINKNPFVILEGPTACGKTTQVPQFILDQSYQERKRCKIIVAQPRRIAATSNAERVANERNWPLGTIVGYQIGFDEKKFLSADTRILYCTTGILLEQLIRAKNFLSYTHIILDEVHERNKDMDFLFIIIKKLFVSCVPKPTVKIIIMSATIQTSRVCFKRRMFFCCCYKNIQNNEIDLHLQFSDYFAFPKQGIMQSAPIITIEQKSTFKVDQYFLEDFYQVAPQFVKKHFYETFIGILFEYSVFMINK